MITKEQAIEALSSVLENWVHGGDADCIIAEFEEKLKENTTIVAIPVWQLKDIEDVLRQTSNLHDSPQRKTCYNRDVMCAWNMVVNALNGDVNLPSHRLTYKQIPKLKD